MNTSQLTVVDENLHEDLAAYGLTRAIAAKKAPVNLDKANFFGVDRRGDEVEMLFTKDDDKLMDAVEDGMELAVVAPEMESFNMLLTRDFSAAVSGRDPETLREFIRRIVDEV